MDLATHHWETSTLAKEIHGRCYSVRCPLSAEYFSCRPPRRFGCVPLPSSSTTERLPRFGFLRLASSLRAIPPTPASLILLLTLRQLPGVTHLSFRGRDVSIPSPPAAGLAVTSPWLDVSRALPSIYRNTNYDIVAPPSDDPSISGCRRLTEQNCVRIDFIEVPIRRC
jgi:hypothetical protein